MSTEIEAELRAAFEAASESVRPRADLAERVRRTSRRRSRLALASALAVIAILAGAAYLASSLVSGQHRPVTGHRTVTSGVGPRLTITLPPGEGVQALAVGGPDLYLATDYGGNPPYALSAYNRTTGRLIRHVGVPAMPAALHVGPGGSVWLTFYPDQGGGPSGTWLLNADLSRRSSAALGSTDILPTSPDTAMLASQYALTILKMPPPGTPGHATAHADPATDINGHLAVNTLTPIAGHVAAQVTDGYGFHSHLVIAGQPHLTFGGSSRQQVGYVTAEDNGLWVTTATRSKPNVGPLVRLSATLRLITPSAIRVNPVLGQAEQVWSHGSTVWVATAAAGHPLVCFTYRGGMGSISTIPLRGQPAALTATGDTVYVTLATGVADITSDVFAYSIPGDCR